MLTITPQFQGPVATLVFLFAKNPGATIFGETWG